MTIESVTLVVRAMSATDHGAPSARDQRRAVAERAMSRSRRVENEVLYRSLTTDLARVILTRSTQPWRMRAVDGRSELGVESGIACGLVQVDPESAGHMGQ
jgi:hypothetical protein